MTYIFSKRYCIFYEVMVKYAQEVLFMGNIKTVQERNELHKAIWNIADELRGSVSGWEFLAPCSIITSLSALHAMSIKPCGMPSIRILSMQSCLNCWPVSAPSPKHRSIKSMHSLVALGPFATGHQSSEQGWCLKFELSWWTIVTKKRLENSSPQSCLASWNTSSNLLS